MTQVFPKSKESVFSLEDSLGLLKDVQNLLDLLDLGVTRSGLLRLSPHLMWQGSH